MRQFFANISDFFHRIFRIPYSLHVEEFQTPKKPKAAYLFIHGMGNTLNSWDEVIDLMPRNVRLIGIDLLGFGQSPKPKWAVYDVKTQARSVIMTLLKLRLTKQPIIVGHSLGSLVSVEVAKRYGLAAKELVLCSPPFYKPEIAGTKLKSNDDILRQLYRVAKKHPEQLPKLAPLLIKLGIANKSFSLTSDTVGIYVEALEASIINQTSLEDVSKLKLPIHIFYGTFDPVVIKKHILTLGKRHENIGVTKLVAGHEIRGAYVKSLARYLTSLPVLRR